MMSRKESGDGHPLPTSEAEQDDTQGDGHDAAPDSPSQDLDIAWGAAASVDDEGPDELAMLQPPSLDDLERDERHDVATQETHVKSQSRAVASDQTFSLLDLRDRVVTMLLFYEVVRVEHVEEAWLQWKAQKDEQSNRDALWRFLPTVDGIEREKVFKIAAQVYAFEEARIERPRVVQFLRDIEDDFADDQWEQMRELGVFPVARLSAPGGHQARLLFATHDPARPDVQRFLQALGQHGFELQYAPEKVLGDVFQEAFPIRKNEYLERVDDDMAFDLGASFDDRKGLVDEAKLDAEISRSGLINLFEATLVEAVRQGASDIHILPNAQRHIEIHFRVDGELGRWYVEDRVPPEAFLAVVKDNASNVDRFEREMGQDGFIQRHVDKTLIRFRVSVLPIANVSMDVRSESVVIRVLDDRKVITDLRKLGLLDRSLERFNHAIRQPHGMVILTGPTGSGKSTTLFAALHQVISPKVNVLTVEDPVEYIIPGVRQIKLSHKFGLEAALRSILRHDPDIVMVGEMRDRETAELAVKLANTGHLTFSTLHTNDAPSAVSRLYKMGVEPFLIAYAINLVVAQRLIRKLCTTCRRVDDDPDPTLLDYAGFSEEEIGTTTLYRAGDNPNCPECGGKAYKGRRAITETLQFSRDIRRSIVASREMIDEDELRTIALKEGMLTLRDSAREVVKRGETTLDEMLRVTASDL